MEAISQGAGKKILCFVQGCLLLLSQHARINFLQTDISSQPAVACSKFTRETLEQGVKYVKLTMANDVVLVSLLLTLNIFHICSSVSIVNFEHGNAGWVQINEKQLSAEAYSQFSNI